MGATAWQPRQGRWVIAGTPVHYTSSVGIHHFPKPSLPPPFSTEDREDIMWIIVQITTVEQGLTHTWCAMAGGTSGVTEGVGYLPLQPTNTSISQRRDTERT